MRIGLYLKGGGAKGAFQAGVLYSLYKKGYRFNVISGTSIGAINGYFLLKDSVEEMKNMYIGMYEGMENIKLSGLTVYNDLPLNVLRGLKKQKNHEIEAFYVNYCPVKNGIMTYVDDNIIDDTNEIAIEKIGYSSRLPYNNKEMTFTEFMKFMNENDLVSKFKKDLSEGVYDFISLDGGMINNNFINDVFKHNLDKVIIISYNNDTENYKEKLSYLGDENLKKIIFINSENNFNINDTYNFTESFINERFNEGVLVGEKFDIDNIIEK